MLHARCAVLIVIGRRSSARGVQVARPGLIVIGATRRARGGAPAPIAFESPADVLPEGWVRQRAIYGGRESYVHESNAETWRDDGGPWFWTTACETTCANERAKPTRDEAMAAAIVRLITTAESRRGEQRGAASDTVLTDARGVAGVPRKP